MRRIMTLLLMAALLMVLTAGPALADLANLNVNLMVGDVNAHINGSPQKLPVSPYLKNGTAMVPISFIANTFGISTEFDAKSKTVTLTKEKTVIKLVIGKKTFVLNGKSKNLAIAPETKNGQTMVPLNFVGSLGISAKYFSDSKSISIADIPNFHFKPATTESWKFLIPEGWKAKQGERAELTVTGEGVGFVFNKFWLNITPPKSSLKSMGEEYINKVKGTIQPDSEISDTNVYSARFEYKGTDAAGKVVDYIGEIKVEPAGKTVTYLVEFRPKNIEIKRDILEKLYVSGSTVIEKRSRS